MERSSSRVLSFTASLCGLSPNQTLTLERAAWAIGRLHPGVSEDDVVQEMALRAWTNHLFRRGTNTGDLIAAGNRAVADRRR